ncbi:MAG: TIGR00282 family metallophosphoesterase [Candidatus Hydrogenedentota bacterium]|nr:MAG: TIGR00282 family metallophosphoesterase [Candidatus Hydrogenedentota bacterium]
MVILFIGDIFGQPGRQCVRRWIPEIREEFSVDIIVANAENAAGGLGATLDILDELSGYGVEAFTFGNHTWRKKSMVDTIDRFANVARPANYAVGVPGQGSVVVNLQDGRKLGIINIMGRVFMEPIDCPFETVEREIGIMKEEVDTILVDFHAEATAEKVAMGWYLDGTCSAVVGTHTHIPTADERVLPQGTAYITDVGMTGPQDSVIGVKKELIIKKFLTGMPVTFEVSKDNPGLRGVMIETDDATGKAVSIQRIARDGL